MNTQKSNAFLYTNNEQVEVKIKNTVLFTSATPKTKYLDINQTNIYMISTRKQQNTNEQNQRTK